MRRPSPRLGVMLVCVALLTAACGDSGGGDAAPLPVPHGERTDALRSVSARIKGSGASFPDAFYQEAIAGLHPAAPSLLVTYEALGSAAGREAFGVGLADFAGTDSLVGADDPIEDGSFLYVPAVASAIAIVVNLPTVEDLRLDAETLAAILQTDVDRWDDPAIAALNPDRDLPAIPIRVARRSDGAGTTKNLTRYLERSAPNWRLGSGDAIAWPPATEGGQQNSGVAQIVGDAEGAIGYVDYGNARELGLDMASILTASGEPVPPSVTSIAAAVDGAVLADDLTYDPIAVDAPSAYPITAPTYLLVRRHPDDPATARAVIGFVGWLITDGADTYGEELGFAPLPARIRSQALAALDELGRAVAPR